ncbi:alpha/beta fold hydrolase [Hymenobacter sp. BT664]|uniref:Alpha/beta fold hydrolase n=1 Tax=Hymenobacter montanus TaxID=2771359 RepID=A0A927BHI1_9BACT|nr:alpha/beta fold hydrolase [Hymenobacter montanus]MBD2770008.1 alpha/beta fold hydrolase [Hymenobacter montanus]
MSKPTLLLLHGALGSPATLQPLAERLAADFTIKSFAFAGHGGREVRPETFTLPHFAAEILAFLAANESEPARVFGYSMGGYAALLAAHQVPARFASITTLGTKLDWSPEAAAAETRLLDPEKIRAKVPAFAEQLRERHAPADWTAVVRATAALMQAAGAAPPLSAADLSGIAVPVQVLVGDADPTVGTEAGAALAARLPRSRYELLPATPHPLERADLTLLSEKIRAFALSA